MAEPRTVRVRVAVVDIGEAAPGFAVSATESVEHLLRRVAQVIPDSGSAVVWLWQEDIALPTEPEVAASVEGQG